MECLKQIKGMQQLLQELPKEYQYLPLFGNIIKLNYKKVFDYEKRMDVYHLTMLVTDDSERYQLQFVLKNVRGSVFFCVSEKLSGLAVHDMKDCGYESDSRYRVYDFENKDFSIFCEDMEISLVKE